MFLSVSLISDEETEKQGTDQSSPSDRLEPGESKLYQEICNQLPCCVEYIQPDILQARLPGHHTSSGADEIGINAADGKKLMSRVVSYVIN